MTVHPQSHTKMARRKSDRIARMNKMIGRKKTKLENPVEFIFVLLRVASWKNHFYENGNAAPHRHRHRAGTFIGERVANDRARLGGMSQRCVGAVVADVAGRPLRTLSDAQPMSQSDKLFASDGELGNFNSQ